jgi:transcriptional regulator with XRE-family HTH domain
MTTLDDLSEMKQHFDQRGADRVEIYVKADTIVGDQDRQIVTLHNISASGGLIEAERPLEMGQVISILVQEDQPVTATIIWASWPLYGCRFQTSLPASMMSALKLRNIMPLELDPTVSHDLPSQLSQRLRQLREEKGFSLAALSRRAGISKPSIWAWETGKTVPRSRSLHALAGALGVPISEILGQKSPQTNRISAAAWGEQAADERQPQSEVEKVVNEARQRIAEVTGISSEKVKISIEF